MPLFGTIPIFNPEPADFWEHVLDLQRARRRGRLPQFGADHAAHPLLDAGGAAPGLYPHRARQGRLGGVGQLPPCAENAILPVVTVIGIEAAFLIGGLIVTETVFNIPGVARYLVEAIRWRDYPDRAESGDVHRA